MFCPKEIKRYENLKTSFTNLVNLVADLHRSGFKGFVEVTHSGKVAYILIFEGKEKLFQQASGGNVISFDGNIEELAEMISPATGIINVYEVEPRHLMFMLNCITATSLYTNLSSEFTDFEKLLKKLSKDNLNGYLEVIFHDSSLQDAFFIYRNGLISSVFKGGNPVDLSEEKLGGIDSLLKKNEALFNVYRIENDKANEHAPNEVNKKNTKIKAEYTQGFSKEDPPITLPLEPDDIENKLPAANLINEEKNNGKKQTDVSIETDVIEALGEDEQADKAKNSYSSSLSNNNEKFSIKPYLNFSGALLKWVEAAVNQVLGKEYFSKVFKKGLLNISDKYPFLDPFLAEFTYTDGTVQFTGEATATEFLSGVYSSVESVFNELSSKEKKEVKKVLKNNRQTLEKKYHEDIEILRVKTFMPLLFQ
jgi:hypothetical protein